MAETMSIDEPTRLEASHRQPTLEQFSREMEADAPTPPPRDAAPDGPPAWRVPRRNPHTSFGGEDVIRTGIAAKDGFLKLHVVAETELSGSALVAARQREAEESIHTDAHTRLVGSDEYARAAGIVPEHAQAERRLKAAAAKLDALTGKRAKLVAEPKSGLGKALVAVDAEIAAARVETAGHQAERDALAPAARDALAALHKAAETTCTACKYEFQAANLKRLESLLSAFYAAHGLELSEIALTSAVRTAGPRTPRRCSVCSRRASRRARRSDPGAEAETPPRDRPMISSLIHRPDYAEDATGATRTLRGKVRCADPSVNAYLLALTRYDEWAPPVEPGFVRVGRHFEPTACGRWCLYSIIDRRPPAAKDTL